MGTLATVGCRVRLGQFPLAGFGLAKKARRKGLQLVTVLDVAKRAGVSAMTVSRVTSGSPNVIEETRARVQAAINELGYTPNVDARNLKSPGQRKIGLLYGNPSASYSNELVVSVLGSLSRLGYQLLLEKCASRRSERLCAEKVIKGGVTGVILPTPL